MFITGLLPTVVDFELAYLVDHFKWICDKNKIQDPFRDFTDLQSIFHKVSNLDGVKQYVELEEIHGKKWISPQKTG